jgi:hypothetical protein
MNPEFPRLVTPPGIVTLVRPVQLWNAETPMAVTVPPTPGRVEGMVTAPPGPLYPVMVMFVPSVVNVKPPWRYVQVTGIIVGSEIV